MALKIVELFSRTDAKSRIFIVLATVFAIVGAIILSSKYLGGGSKVAGNAKVAGAPSLQSVPGGQLTPEYYRALMQANAQSAQQAQVSGASAVPTLVNTAQSSDCTIICPGGDSADVTADINDLVRQGKLSQTDANQLLAMAKANVPVSEYSAYLDSLVKQGKLTPEQARKLLAEYQRQHANASVTESAQMMDALIKSGKLPIDAANDLLELQKQNVSPAAYADELNRLVREGKISPETAAQLLAQYTQLQAKKAAEESASKLKQMALNGQISADAANDLLALQKRNVPVSDYEAELNRLVAAGKMTPATAAQLLADYKAQHAALGPAAALSSMVDSLQAQNDQDLADIVKGGHLPQADADNLLALEKRGASQQEYDAAIDELVKEGKLTPEQAAKLKANYAKLQALRGESNKLIALQGNNASLAQYSAELTRAVDAKILTPEQAAALLEQYKALITPVITPANGANPGVQTNVAGGENFAVLQQRLAAQQPTGTATAPAGADQSAQFAAAEAEAEAQAARDQQQRVQAYMSAMSSQAQELVTAWQPPIMQYRAGNEEKTKTTTTTTTATNGGGNKNNGAGGAESESPPLIKAGTILFAILTTAVDSDYPDTPVMATIVSGPFKGAILLGKLSLAQGQDKVSLNFTMMNRDEWIKSKSVTAFAIDPDTARTVMASNVNYHYWYRYGGLFASSFLTGYSNAISQAGSTTTSGIFGTSSTHPQLSPGNEIAIGLGQVGTTFGAILANNVNTPATVKVNSGVGLGILFMADVT